MKIVFNNDVKWKILLSIVKNNYVLAYYNAADLSMLNDFEELKEKLNNSSYLWVNH